MTPTSPPGTVPLMAFMTGEGHLTWDSAAGVHEMNDRCVVCPPATRAWYADCRCVGFRVVDEPVFEAWRKEQLG